jgi:2-dehydropantoate 2-reductase
MSSIAVVGPGAIGSVIATMLHTQGHDVLLCARRPVGELIVHSERGEVRWMPRVATAPPEPGSVDWVLICTKAYDATSAAAWLPTLCASGAPVAVLQNGVEHRERFANVVPHDRLVPVMIDLPAERTDGVVRQRGPAKMSVADDSLGRRFAALFNGTGAAITLTDDLKTALWRKLCVNAVGVISGIVDRPAGVMRLLEAQQLGRNIIEEVVKVGRAEGAKLDDNLIEAVLAGCATAPTDAINSLHADRRAGRQTEIDARNGVIVRLGAKHGIATPYNAMALALISICR